MSNDRAETPPSSSQALEVSHNRLQVTSPEDQTKDPDTEKDFVQSHNYNVTRLPDAVFYKLYNFIGIEDIKNCRLTCKRFNRTILESLVLKRRSIFMFDGRRDDALGSKAAAYFDGTDGSVKGSSRWSELWIRRGYLKQLSWISRKYTSTITRLAIKNSSMNWHSVLGMLAEFENLNSYSDTLDMFFWDYMSFTDGIRENEDILESTHYKQLAPEKQKGFKRTLENLRHITIHRCQLGDCALYLRIFLLYCRQLESLDVTTDQSVSPRPFGDFYNYLGQTIQANEGTLKTIWFPFKTIYPSIEFHVTEANSPFNFFLNYISENNWASTIQPKALEALNIQFPAIQTEENPFLHKLLPFLLSWTSSSSSTFKKLYLNSLYLEPGKEHVISDFLPSSLGFEREFGVWMVDTDGIPFIEHIQSCIKYINVQLWRPISTELKHILMLDDFEFDDEIVDDIQQRREENGDGKYFNVTELQFFNKSVNFKSFNMNLIMKNFTNLTHLNLVDYNTRVDRVHSSESPATIEDEDVQKMFKFLTQLVFIQLIGNMAYLTDHGITGLKLDACKRMLKRSHYEKQSRDQVGLSFTALKRLRTLVLRGVGIKVTDVTAHFGFIDMPRLKTIHIFGSHQITREGRAVLTQRFPVSRGCDVQL